MTLTEQPQHSNKYTLPKKERLSSKKIIEELFKKGSSSFLYPIKLIYLTKEEDAAPQEFPQVLFSVSKKKFRKAVDRNKVKRRLREAYRLHKHDFFKSFDHNNPQYLAVIYVAKDILSFQEIERKLILIFKRLQN